MSKFTNAEKQREAEREVKMRTEVYGRGVLGPIQQRRIAIMTEIAEDYAALAKKDQPSLLGD